MDTSGKPRQREDVHPPSDAAGSVSRDDTLNMRELIGKFWVRKWLIAACVVIGGAVALLTAKLTTPTYTASAMVLITPIRGGEPAAKAALQGAIQGGPEAVPTEAIVLQSRTLAKETIERLHLDRNQEFAPQSDGSVSTAEINPATAPAPAESPPPSALVDAFLGKLRVTVEPRSNVIQVSFKSVNPTTAARVPNTLVQLYLERLASQKNRALAEESDRLDRVVLPMLRQKMYDSEADRQTYEQAVARSDELHGDMGHARPDASLLSPADIPLYPSFPRTNLMVLAGAGLGAGVAFLLIVLLDWFRGGLRTIDRLESALGIRCLGGVPMLDRNRGKRADGPLSQPVDSAFGQAMRKIQLKLRISGPRSGSQVILVTSTLPGEGKTWTSVSLAASLAADGVSVALIDCDLYRPNLHRSLHGQLAPGLTDYFAGTASFAEIVHRTGDGKIRYVPVGGSASGKARSCFRTERLLPIIDHLTKECEFVIIDSAPVLAISETMLLARAVDTTLLIVKWESTSAALARQALRQLREGGAEPIAVLSMVDMKRAVQYGDPVAGAYKQLESYYLQSPRT